MQTIDDLKKLLKKDPHKMYFATSAEIDKDLFSSITEWMIKRGFSHTLIIYYSLDLGDFVIGNAHGKAAQLDTLEQMYGCGDCIATLYEKDLTPKERHTCMRAIIEMDGIPYSVGQIKDIGIHKLFGITSDENGLEGVICSEYGDRISKAAGLITASDMLEKSIDLINPADNVDSWDTQILRDDFRKLL